VRGRGGPLLLAVVVLGLAVAAVFVDFPTGDQLRARLQDFGGFAPVVFVTGCAVGTALFFPKPVLATAAGLLFGVLPGLALAVTGCTVGALIAFGAARALGRHRVAAWLGRGRLRVLDEVFARRGLAATLVVRLLPVVPFAAANYCAGATAVSGRSFALGTALGLLPSTLLAVLLGDALGELGSPRSFVLIGAWLVLSVVAVLWGRRLLAAGQVPATAPTG
jgi:uncharacterized membrane protein YdjX (TVP38/TMEM64 family)